MSVSAGEPGRPGEPGTAKTGGAGGQGGTGGAGGGHGGEGGHGGDYINGRHHPRLRIKTFPFVVVVVAVVTQVVVFWQVGKTINDNKEARRQSCAATLIALQSVRDTAAAGIRPVPRDLPGDTPEALMSAFREERRSTILENDRRHGVIKIVQQASAKLRGSTFCNP